MADEILKNAELEKVVGGSGVETMALMSRLQNAGLAKFHTPLVAGNEDAAATELKAYLKGLKNAYGRNLFDDPIIYSDRASNDYFNGMALVLRVPFPDATNNDIVFTYIKDNLR